MDTIPFRYSRQGWIVLPVTIKTSRKAVKGDFFYDSGAITMLASDSLYNALEAKYVHGTLPIPSNTVYGTKYDTLSDIKSVDLQIGSSHYRMLSLKADRNNYFADDSLVGVIGPNFFGNQKLLIDFENKHLIVNPTTLVNDKWVKVKMSSIAVGKNPVLKDLKIDNLPMLDWYIDTGNPFDLIIQTKDLKMIENASAVFYPYQLAQKERAVDAAGHLGDSIQYRYKGNGIGGQLANPFTAFATIIKEDKKSRSNNMGIGFMKKVFSKVIFDGPGKAFYYKIASLDTIERGPLLSEVALAGTASKDIYVRAISINSTWFKQGLRADHFITAVNGKPVSYWLQRMDEFRKIDYASFEFLDNATRRVIYK